MASSKDIRRRIKSINSTKKITRAMEMVSAAKMRKAVASVIAIRPYAHSAWSVLTNLARAYESHGRGLLEIREVKSVLIVVVTSNRGLCGSFNTQIAKKIKDEILHPEKLKINRINGKKLDSKIKDEDLRIDFIVIGKKGEGIVRKLHPVKSAEGGPASQEFNRVKQEIIASFADGGQFVSANDIKPLSKIVIDDYLNKKYDKVVAIYTDYLSTIVQKTRIRQILPISKIDIEKQIAEMDVIAKEYGLSESVVEYKVEPSPREVLEFIIPRLIEMQLFHAILESKASEESARMMAMRNATDAAGEMSEDLTLAYNQIRQGKITQEIAEISAGRAALE
ncbi:MAG TPA: ATP synthase F1 subunit gamma [Candidatus Moranbacteria bacterium]|nr:ATP synthase F1 subunit gamma [Candidatus Moranbacteria bacterium]